MDFGNQEKVYAPQAVKEFLNDLHATGREYFNSSDLIAYVRHRTGSPKMYDGSIMRRMRELRTTYSIIATNKVKSIYRCVKRS